MNKIPFSPPYIDDDVVNLVIECLKSGWITSGPKVKELEFEIKNYTGCPEALCVNSWTSGAMLVMKWFGIGPGDEVIIPAYTYAATALSVIHCGATPIMVDVQEDFTIDPDKIRSAINARTKIIMPVDFGGLCCDYGAINSLVEESEIKGQFCPSSNQQTKLGRILVISDAAHSFGAKYGDKMSGNATDITIFSFHAVKNLTTAEGGAVCLNLPSPFDNEETFRSMKLWSLNGQTKDAFTKTQGGGWKYDILFPGLKMNLPDLSAAIGLAQIKKYNSHLLLERKRVALRYHEFFKRFNYFELPILQDEKRESCYHLYALRIESVSELQRDKIVDEITLAGVSVNVHFIPLPMFTAFKNMGYEIGNYPITFDNYNREISLPIYPQLLDEDIDFVCDVVLRAYKKIVLDD